MKVIRPTAITEAVLLASNVVENDHQLWSGSANYGASARVIRPPSHRVYESAITNNSGHDPIAGGGQWLDVGPTNRWAMFDTAAGPSTDVAGDVDLTLAPSIAVDSLGLVDVSAASIRVQVSVGGVTTYDRSIAAPASCVGLFDLPASAGQQIRVRLFAAPGGAVAIGKLSIGRALDLGDTEDGPTIGIADYSRRETDDFGVTTIVQRAWAKRLSIRSLLDSAAVDTVQAELATLRAQPAIWVGDASFPALTTYGFFKDFSIDLQLGQTSYCSLTIEGLPSAEIDVALTDPAPEADSDVMVIRPMTIDDSVFVSSSVAENDYPAWSSATVYALGARVIRQHRIYENLVANNTANPPIGNAAWLDVGPTNRWAMFDQATGSATAATAAIVVTLLAASAITAMAILDTDAATVRVQSGAFDRTIAVNGVASMLDLTIAVGASVTITISGAGSAVSVGTMLLGSLERLGRAENSPTVGIIDYSKKVTDDFGNTSAVERAWTRRMQIGLLVASGSADAMLRRMARLRATPALWIGQAGFQSLTIYGFFRDFTIKLAENVSQCSLTIEGLSEVAPLAKAEPAVVNWPDIVDSDPARPKPADGATNTALPSAPLGDGGMTVGTFLNLQSQALHDIGGLQVDAGLLEGRILTAEGTIAGHTEMIGVPGAAVRTIWQAIDSVEGQLGSLDITVRAGANLLANGGLEQGDFTDWGNGWGDWSIDPTGYSGLGPVSYINNPPVSASDQYFHQYTTYAAQAMIDGAQVGYAYTFTCDPLMFMTSGNGYYYSQIAWYDADNNLLKADQTVPRLAANFDFDPTDQKRRAIKATSTAPSGAVRCVGAIVFYIQANAVCSGIAWRRAKLERGTEATPFSAEAAVRQSFKAIFSNETQVASILSQVGVPGADARTLWQAIHNGDDSVASILSQVGVSGADARTLWQAIHNGDTNYAQLESKVSTQAPNLCKFGGFENGLNGWDVVVGGAGVTELDGDGQAAYGVNVGLNLLIGAPIPVTPGRTYTIACDPYATDAGSYVFSDFYFIDASGNQVGSYSPQPAQSGPRGFSSSDASRFAIASTMAAPAGAVSLKPRIGLWISGGGRSARARLVKVEQAATPSPYSSEASVRQSFASINGAYARAALTLDVNGYLTGWEADNNGRSGGMRVNGDYFEVRKPGGGASMQWIANVAGSGKPQILVDDGSGSTVEIGWLP